MPGEAKGSRTAFQVVSFLEKELRGMGAGIDLESQ